jgi:hypothetical protein
MYISDIYSHHIVFRKLFQQSVLTSRVTALTFGLIIAGYLQYRTLSGTLDELQAEQRPWASFEPSQIQLIPGLEYNVNGANFTMHFPIHNIGKQARTVKDLRLSRDPAGPEYAD